MKQKTQSIQFFIGNRRASLMLHVHRDRQSYAASRFARSICWNARAHFYAHKRRRNIGHIHVVSGDLEALLHECHHAARQAVRLGLVSPKTCSRQSYEERIAVAHGCIGAAVMRVWLDTVPR